MNIEDKLEELNQSFQEYFQRTQNVEDSAEQFLKFQQSVDELNRLQSERFSAIEKQIDGLQKQTEKAVEVVQENSEKLDENLQIVKDEVIEPIQQIAEAVPDIPSE